MSAAALVITDFVGPTMQATETGDKRIEDRKLRHVSPETVKQNEENERQARTTSLCFARSRRRTEGLRKPVIDQESDGSSYINEMCLPRPSAPVARNASAINNQHSHVVARHCFSTLMKASNCQMLPRTANRLRKQLRTRNCKKRMRLAYLVADRHGRYAPAAIMDSTPPHIVTALPHILHSLIPSTSARLEQLYAETLGPLIQ
jgi:hypothetical protein